MASSSKTFFGAVGHKMGESLSQLAYVWGSNSYHPPFAATNLITVDPDVPAPGDLNAEIRFQARLIYREEGDFAYQQDKAVYKRVRKSRELKNGLNETSLNACVASIMKSFYDSKITKSRVVFKKSAELNNTLKKEVAEIKKINPAVLEANIQQFDDQVKERDRILEEKDREMKVLDAKLLRLIEEHKVEADLKKYNRIVNAIAKIKEKIKLPEKKNFRDVVLQLSRKQTRLKLILKLLTLQEEKLCKKLEPFRMQEKPIQADIAQNRKSYQIIRDQRYAILSQRKLEENKRNIKQYKLSRLRDHEKTKSAFIQFKRESVIQKLKEFIVQSELVKWINQNIAIADSTLASLYQIYLVSKSEADLKNLVVYIENNSPVLRNFSKHAPHTDIIRLMQQKIKWDQKHPTKPFRPPYWCPLSEFATKKAYLSAAAKNIETKQQHSPAMHTQVLSVSRPQSPSRMEVGQSIEDKGVGLGSLRIDPKLTALQSQEVKSPTLSPVPSPRSPHVSPRNISQSEQALIELEMPRLSTVGLTHNPGRLVNSLFIAGPINIVMNVPVLNKLTSPLLLAKATVDGIVEGVSFGCSFAHRYKARKKKAAELALMKARKQEMQRIEDSRIARPRLSTAAAVNQVLMSAESSASSRSPETPRVSLIAAESSINPVPQSIKRQPVRNKNQLFAPSRLPQLPELTPDLPLPGVVSSDQSVEATPKPSHQRHVTVVKLNLSKIYG